MQNKKVKIYFSFKQRLKKTFTLKSCAKGQKLKVSFLQLGAWNNLAQIAECQLLVDLRRVYYTLLKY